MALRSTAAGASVTVRDNDSLGEPLRIASCSGCSANRYAHRGDTDSVAQVEAWAVRHAGECKAQPWPAVTS
jgi:hypothetical protein